jgi:hypothetical protein
MQRSLDRAAKAAIFCDIERTKCLDIFEKSLLFSSLIQMPPLLLPFVISIT